MPPATLLEIASEPSRWRKMARSRRPGQTPRPRREKGKWKIWYRKDTVSAEGVHRRFQTSRTLGDVKTMSFSEASRLSREFILPINDVQTGVEYSARTFGDLVIRWRRTVKPTLKGSTQHSYEWAAVHMLAEWKETPVSKIERADVQEFLLSRPGLSPVSIHNLRAHLSGLLTVAVEWEWLSANPAKGRFRLPAPEPVRPAVILRPEQIRLLLETLPEPYDSVFGLAVLCGLRPGEIGALRWDDLVNKEVTIRRRVYRGVLDTPKSQRSRATLPVDRGIWGRLEAWRSRTRFPSGESYVFAVRRDSPLDMHNALRRKLQPAARFVGLTRLCWRDLRPTFCTLGRQSGVSPEGMQKLMRHRDVSTTLGVYSRFGGVAELEKISALVH